ncbi:pca operon transcription factor PcaQ [Tateyamaria sp.]|uniref:pca operon transcription factor PcaQ n=1 Tax=Tateyamaria sp. TaxID=1929288 RepID=UPI003B20D4A6
METIDLRAIKMRHLAAFSETLRTGSLKTAAERLNLTQSAISKSIKDLESVLGVVLLERNRGGIALTPEGALFRQFADQGLNAVRNGLASLQALASGQDAPLRIGALPSVAADFLPRAIVHFMERAPATPLSVQDGPVEALVARLRSGEVDLVIGRAGAPEIMAGVSFTQLYAEQVIFAAAADHPLAHVDDVQALGAVPILYPPPEAAIRPLVDAFLSETNTQAWTRTLETVSSAFGRAITLGPARAVWIISHGVVARDIAAGRMVQLPIDTRDMAGPIGVMARSEEDLTPPIRLFRQSLLAVAR